MFTAVARLGARASGTTSVQGSRLIREMTRGGMVRAISGAGAGTRHTVDVVNDYEKVQITQKKGLDLIQDSSWNKGTAWTLAERDRLGLRGLVPPKVSNFAFQHEDILRRLRKLKKNLTKNLFLHSLWDRNETLFYSVLINNIKELAPIIYTPTVGEACLEAHNTFSRPRGMFFSLEDKGHMRTMVHNWPEEQVDVIVVTDGGRILGLGDLGGNGMGISIGKSALYVAAGGVEPTRVLPCMLDVGTNNEDLLAPDSTYLGIKQRRLDGEAYWELVDEFMRAARERWPNVLIQFEDFSPDKAPKVLDKYRHHHLCFNDDIQGTGAMTLGGIFSALRAQGKSLEAITEQRIVVAGAGSAGVGVCHSLIHGMIHEGCDIKKAYQNFYLVDMHGLIGHDRQGLEPQHVDFARHDLEDGMSLHDVVKEVKPTILLGLSGQKDLFKEETIRLMAEYNEQPVIFPMSNPTSKCECSAENVYKWTDGRAIFASGSPFDPVTINGTTYSPSQANNVFIFPGVGLAAVLCQPTRISNIMFLAASRRLAELCKEEDRVKGRVYPDVEDIREVSKEIAIAVCRSAYEFGFATTPEPANLRGFVEGMMYYPHYDDIVYKPGQASIPSTH